MTTDYLYVGCPFCGSENQAISEDDGLYFVRCKNCLAVGEGGNTVDEAVDNFKSNKFTEMTVKLARHRNYTEEIDPWINLAGAIIRAEFDDYKRTLMVQHIYETEGIEGVYAISVKHKDHNRRTREINLEGRDIVVCYNEATKDLISPQLFEKRLKEAKDSADRYFHSSYFSGICSIDGSYFMKLAMRQYPYDIWRKKTGCGKCKKLVSECKHKAYPWLEWERGMRTCNKKRRNKKEKSK